MDNTTEKIGLGGGCHWCTEGVFNSLLGISKVEQGWIQPLVEKEEQPFSEAIIVHFDPKKITEEVLIEIHLHTHSCTARHSMRGKYRSAVYVFSEEQKHRATLLLKELQKDFSDPIITESIDFGAFRKNTEDFEDYFYKRPNAPFCKTYIHPKIMLLMEQYKDQLDESKINAIKAHL